MYQRSLARTSLTLRLLAITGRMALLLGIIGLYGTVSYTISQQRREIGIRLALGAERGAVRRMFVTGAATSSSTAHPATGRGPTLESFSIR